MVGSRREFRVLIKVAFQFLFSSVRVEQEQSGVGGNRAATSSGEFVIGFAGTCGSFLNFEE